MKGIGILGKKLGMTQIFKEDGTVVPVTVIKAGPVYIVDIKTPERDGYEAIKVGYEEIDEKRAGKVLNKPLLGIFKKAGTPPLRYLKEFRFPGITQKFGEVGKVIKLTDIFKEGDKVDIAGTTKGRGFAGAMKRHGFSGGPKSHGAGQWHRRVGAISAGTFPGEVKPGKRMPGHYGVERVTVKNLEVVKIYPEQDIMLVKGSVPGPIGGLLEIRLAYGLGPQEKR